MNTPLRTSRQKLNPAFLPVRMRGMVTVYTCIMILLLMATMLLYTTRSSITEQTLSRNELDQKQAFHVADSGIKLAYEWLLANNTLINADVEDMLGSGIDGWMVAGSPRWKKCGDVNYADDRTHPCWAEPNDNRRDHSYFYFWDGSTALPIDTSVFGSANTQVRVEALFCLIDLDLGPLSAVTSPILGCQVDPALVNGSHFMVTLLARGEADCNGGQCRAKALISEKVTNFTISAFAKIPGVPLITNSDFPASGVAEIVSNPNGGGPGIPLSIWGNGNESCSGQSPLTPNLDGWSSCSALEWYGESLIPSDLSCALGDCSCPADDLIGSLFDVLEGLGADVILDEAFPCDLFQFYFGQAREDYRRVRDSIQVINDCSELDANSAGAYWVTGESCIIPSNTVVGSAEHPVMLISAAAHTWMKNDAVLYGTLFLTDVEDEDASFTSTGHATVFGSVVADGVDGDVSGTFQVVYNDDITVDTSATGGLGSITGSWTDFHTYWE